MYSHYSRFSGIVGENLSLILQKQSAVFSYNFWHSKEHTTVLRYQTLSKIVIMTTMIIIIIIIIIIDMIMIMISIKNNFYDGDKS